MLRYRYFTSWKYIITITDKVPDVPPNHARIQSRGPWYISPAPWCLDRSAYTNRFVLHGWTRDIPIELVVVNVASFNQRLYTNLILE